MNARLLLRPDVFAILGSLPKDLYTTYDKILEEISASHHDLASTALRWLTLAHQPLLIEELIEACSISQEDGGKLLETRRLRPLDLLKLLPNLISIEPAISISNSTDVVRGIHRVVLAHFSVKEYLLGDDMATGLKPTFRIDTPTSHQFIARSCVAYLYHTNTQRERASFRPLRQYAWDLWALHLAARTITISIETEREALDTFEIVASQAPTSRYSPDNFETMLRNPQDSQIRLTLSKLDTLVAGMFDATQRNQFMRTLQEPCFFEEYLEPSQRLFSTIPDQHIRLVQLHNSLHWFAPIRCSMMTHSLASRPSYEAVSYHWGIHGEDSVIWVNGKLVNVRPSLSQLLRGLRVGQGCRSLWVDAVSQLSRNQCPVEAVHSLQLRRA